MLVEHYGPVTDMIRFGIDNAHFIAPLGLSMAYTVRQRMWFRERDGYECQAQRLGIPHDCNGDRSIPADKRRLQIHHLIPQRYAKHVGIPNADFPENGITLCERFHQGVIHPDMKKTRARYFQGEKGAFSRLGEERQKILDGRSIYWNDEYDRRLSTRAVQLTQRFDKQFPSR